MGKIGFLLFWIRNARPTQSLRGTMFQKAQSVLECSPYAVIDFIKYDVIYFITLFRLSLIALCFKFIALRASKDARLKSYE